MTVRPTAQHSAHRCTHRCTHPSAAQHGAPLGTDHTARLAARPHRRVHASGGCEPGGRRPRHPRAACARAAGTVGAVGTPGTAAPDRHDARALAARFAHQLVEVLTGARPSGQLMRHTSLDGYGQLASLVRAGALRRGGPADRPRLGPVHDRSPSPDAVEACVRVDLGRRHHMVAFRLEQRGQAGQWQCTAVEAR
ncbi:Rv3235 family protein [Kitasatospora sp. NPDC127059]|uniref:Rv3235 family protein n=1 Tax=unclassified Kitasatospora TaxID=2633591 RepID=UPI00365E5204